MIDFIRKHIAVIAALLLAWFSWSDYSVETKPKKAEAKTRIPDFGPELMHVRGPDEVLPELSCDPYRFTDMQRAADQAAQVLAEQAAAETEAGARAAAEQEPSRPPIDPAAFAAAFEDSVHRLLQEGVAGLGEALGALLPRPEENLPPAFEVTLQSVLARPGGGQARLNGRTVEVGQALPGLDPDSPPVLYAVAGTTAILRHRGELHVLDLLANPVLQVGGPAPASPAEPAGGQVSGPSTPLTPKQRAAASAKNASPPPGQPNPVKPKGKVRRVRGKLPGGH